MERIPTILDPDGNIITPADLPPPDTKRWSAYKKAVMVLAVQHNLISLQEVLGQYRMSIEEFYGWRTAFEQSGVSGLKMKSLVQRYRAG